MNFKNSNRPRGGEHQSGTSPGKAEALYLTELQVAGIIGCSVSKLRQDRHRCRGIAYTKFGRSVRYAMKDVAQVMDENRVIPCRNNYNNRLVNSD